MPARSVVVLGRRSRTPFLTTICALWYLPILLKDDHSTLRVLSALVYGSLDGCCVVRVPISHGPMVLECSMSSHDAGDMHVQPLLSCLHVHSSSAHSQRTNEKRGWRDLP